MSIYVSHLVFVALCDARYQVVNDRLDCSEGGDVLSRAVVDFDLDGLVAILVLLFRKGECDCDV